MHPNVYRLSMAACLTLSFSSVLQAAHPINLSDTQFQNLKQEFNLVLPGASSHLTKSTNSLKFLKKHTDKNQINHIRMQQHYQGYLVYGGSAIFHTPNTLQGIQKTGQSVTMNGTLYQDLETDLGLAPKDFAQNASKVLQDFKKPYQQFKLSEEQVTPIVYVDENNKAHWAYKLSVFVEYNDKIPERPTAILDAQTHKPYLKWNDVKTQKPGKISVLGRGFGGNDKVGQSEYGNDLPLLEITRSSRGKCMMQNKDVRVVDMHHKYNYPNRAMSFNCREDSGEAGVYWLGYDSDGYDSINGAYSPSNDALYAGYVIKHMYHDWYNVEVLTRNGSPMQLVMRVHYGDEYENAYWDGKQMTFGDGQDFMYPLVSLGVGGHEISHGFTEQHSGLEYEGQSGGMNEAFSDMAAQAAEYYSIGKSSWMIGAEIMKPDSGMMALRWMDLPSRDGESIDSADEYYKGLDVHYSSGVYNRLYYTLATTEGWDPRKAFDVMVKANMDYWTERETFNTGGCGLISAARDLGYSIDDVKKSLAVVAIDYHLCK